MGSRVLTVWWFFDTLNRPYCKYFRMGGVFMKKLTKIFAIGLLLVILVGVGSVIKDHRYLTDHVIRLHVVANSDSQADQQLKLQVRDGVIAYLSDNADPHMTVQQAAQWLESQLPQLQAVAEKRAAAAGWTGSVAVSFAREVFPTREYDTFSLPAGVYQSLRITLGEGAGKNWWCVVFPSLCLPATTEDFQDTAVGAGFSETLTDTLTGEKPYEIRFFLLDWLGQLENFLFWR